MSVDFLGENLATVLLPNQDMIVSNDSTQLVTYTDEEYSILQNVLQGGMVQDTIVCSDIADQHSKEVTLGWLYSIHNIQQNLHNDTISMQDEKKVLQSFADQKIHLQALALQV